jgi:rfaE bifunctional protein kinase chain/domain
MNGSDLRKLSTELHKLTVAVVGDIFLDKYTYGLVRGTSKETPVPLYEFERRVLVPGAAGNVAANFAALGLNVHLLGLVGNDDDGRALLRALRAKNVKTEHLVKLPSLPTNSYEKMVARAPNGKPQELLLVQTRMSHSVAVDTARPKIVSSLRKLSHTLDAVIAVDQVSHLCDRTLFRSLISLTHKADILSVANSRHQVRLCRGFDVLVVNELEASQATGIPPTPEKYNALGKALLPHVRNAVLLTTGPDGMRLFEKKFAPLHHPSVAREVLDITGAGDTALAAYVSARLVKLEPREALLFSNAAAAVVTAMQGTATADIQEISAYLDSL